jgi:NAD(P)-dependent dehydrogenase (short-subunit alcohol dehydrogenase family)
LKGKTAIVTGAGSGIGAATAAEFAAIGMNVVVSDIRSEPLEAVRQRLADAGAKVAAFVADVSDHRDVDTLADGAEQSFGDIHVAFNNAGVAMHGTPLTDIPLDDWRWVIDVNILGLVNCIRRFVPLLRKHGGDAHMINTASIGGLQVNPQWLTGAYSMTKFAAVALSEALEQELASTRVRVSVLCPGAVATNLASAGSRPERLGGSTERLQQRFLQDAIAHGTSPEYVARRVLEAIQGQEFYVFTDTSSRPALEKRHSRIHDAMDAFQRRAERIEA